MTSLEGDLLSFIICRNRCPNAAWGGTPCRKFCPYAAKGGTLWQSILVNLGNGDSNLGSSYGNGDGNLGSSYGNGYGNSGSSYGNGDGSNPINEGGNPTSRKGYGRTSLQSLVKAASEGGNPTSLAGYGGTSLQLEAAGAEDSILAASGDYLFSTMGFLLMVFVIIILDVIMLWCFCLFSALFNTFHTPPRY